MNKEQQKYKGVHLGTYFTKKGNHKFEVFISSKRDRDEAKTFKKLTIKK